MPDPSESQVSQSRGWPRAANCVMTRYTFPTRDPLAAVQVECVGRRTGPPEYAFDAFANVWAVRYMGRCLTRDGEWIWEPIPSERDEDFLAWTRFELQDAVNRAQAVADEIRSQPQ